MTNRSAIQLSSIMMTSIRTYLGLLVLGLGLIVSMAAPAAAQNSHTIRIQDGSVFIDDERVPDEDLPESLDIADMSATFSFSGDNRTLLDLGGHVFMLEDGRLVEVDSDEADNGLVVFFAADRDGTPVRFVNRDDEWAHQYHVRTRGDNTYAFYGDALFDQARKMEELKARLADQKTMKFQAGEIEGTVVELTAAAENTARMAEALPRIQFQSYLESIGEKDAALYEELQREQQLEMKTRVLAQKIRASGSADDRRKLVEELRKDLADIFELKQKNREREIEQLARRLEALETRLEERQELRERIIEARLNELIGRSDW